MKTIKWRGLFLLTIFLVVFSFPSYAYFHHESPIEWQEYSQETFDKAERENKPVFMLITAIWCYWCHVYRDESLHNPLIYEYLNDNYVNVFVDADKRQDLTRQYLAGGWPTTAIFSPKGAKITAFTGHRPKENLRENLEKVVEFVKTNNLEPAEKEGKSTGIRFSPTRNDLQTLLNDFPNIAFAGFDSEFGGYGSGQKFPRAVLQDFILEIYERTKERMWLDLVTKTLDNMHYEEFVDDYSKEVEERVFRGIYDPVDGGFFRYATTRDWTGPHYEKMLFIQARLIKSYLHAYDITKNEKYKEIALNSLQYIENNLYDKNGGFYGSQDAGHEVYYRLRPEERTKDKAPIIDFTKYSEWNGEMILTMFYAANVLDDDSYREMATNTLNFFQDSMISDDGVLHYFDRDEGKGLLNGQLIDNAWMAQAFIEGYKETQDAKYLRTATDIVEYSLNRLYDKNVGGFYERNSTNTDLYLKKELFLDSKPFNGNVIMANALVKLYDITKNEEYLKKSLETIGQFLGKSVEIDNLPYTLRSVFYILENDIDIDKFATREEFTLSTENLGKLNFFNKPILLLNLIAIIAGLLSFLSPCTLPILPAYFAYTFRSKRKKITAATIAFFAGLALTFSIMGMTATFIGTFLRENVLAISRVAGLLILIFGILILFGKGFPGLKIRSKPSKGFFGSFGLGITFAIAWTPCIGPILTAILILAATANTVLIGGTLLFLYAVGLAVPLILISVFFDKLDKKSRFWRILEGKEIKLRIGKKELKFHTTNIVSGLLFILLGILMMGGILYTFNRYVIESKLQVLLFNLEDKIITWLGRF